jgi:hypothetical protein
VNFGPLQGVLDISATYRVAMKSRIITALSLTGVLATGAAAAAVNTQALWPSSDSVTLTSNAQTDASVDQETLIDSDTPVPTATEAAMITESIKAAAASTDDSSASSSDTSDDADVDADDDDMDDDDATEVEDESDDDEDDVESDEVESD